MMLGKGGLLIVTEPFKAYNCKIVLASDLNKNDHVFLVVNESDYLKVVHALNN